MAENLSGKVNPYAKKVAKTEVEVVTSAPDRPRNLSALLAGKAVEDLKDSPLKDETIAELYKGKQPGDHMRNFFECTVDRTQPISDVHTHHRAMTTCHLANIAIRLNRTLRWDPESEQIVGDAQAALWQAREQRKGYEIDV